MLRIQINKTDKVPILREFVLKRQPTKEGISGNKYNVKEFEGTLGGQ